MRFLKPYRKLLIIGPLFKLFEAILEIFLPFLMAKVIDNGVIANDTAYIYRMGGLMLLTSVFGLCFALICQYSASLVSQGVGTDIRNSLFRHIGTLSDAELDSFGTSSLVNRVTNDVNLIQQGVAMLIRLVVRAPFLCIGGIVMCFAIDKKLAVIVLIVVIAFIVILILTMKKTVPLYKGVQKKLDAIALVIREGLSGVRVVRAFSKEKYEENRFNEVNDSYYDEAVKVAGISAMVNPLTTMVMNAAVCAIIWFGGVRVNSANMTTGNVIAFVSYVAQILAALIIISNLVILYTKAFAAKDRITQVFRTSCSIREDYVEDDIEDSNSEYEVEFKDVCMTYEKDSEYDIEHISFGAKKGELIGVIGGTGSGKSTLVNMIYRAYDADEGEVLVEGKNVKKYRLDKLRGMIGLVPQKTVLFSGTIKDNIRWGRPDATDNEISEAARVAQAAEFIEKMPDAYDTMITRGGTNVSGGQRQRLTIARAVVRKPAIMILDDSFSALDYLTDFKLRQGLADYCKNMTTFIVSQRVSTIKNADKIIVMNEGTIAGIGKHDELYDDCEVYREIYDSQNQTDSKKGTANHEK